MPRAPASLAHEALHPRRHPCLRAEAAAERVLVPAMKRMPTKRLFSRTNVTQDSLAFSLLFDNANGGRARQDGRGQRGGASRCGAACCLPPYC